MAKGEAWRQGCGASARMLTGCPSGSFTQSPPPKTLCGASISARPASCMRRRTLGEGSRRAPGQHPRRGAAALAPRLALRHQRARRLCAPGPRRAVASRGAAASPRPCAAAHAQSRQDDRLLYQDAGHAGHRPRAGHHRLPASAGWRRPSYRGALGGCAAGLPPCELRGRIARRDRSRRAPDSERRLQERLGLRPPRPRLELLPLPARPVEQPRRVFLRHRSDPRRRLMAGRGSSGGGFALSLGPGAGRVPAQLRGGMSRNLLGGETSPYLLQHSDNPAHWQAWGKDALDRARQEDKPILLSIGYAACHWCHVMAHESFENTDIAALMNERFVSVKVDREERPDLDAIYQHALMLMGQQGGWPLTMFLLPSGEPFWGGTYFPPTMRWGRPGFPDVLRAIADAYGKDRGKLREQADKLRGALAKLGSPAAGEALEPDLAAIPAWPARH